MATKNVSAYESFCNEVDRAHAANPQDAAIAATKNILSKTASFLVDERLVIATGGTSTTATAMESLGTTVRLNDAVQFSDRETLMTAIEGLIDDTVPAGASLNARTRTSLIKQLGGVLSGQNATVDHFNRERGEEGRMSLDQVVSPTAASVYRADAESAMEAFGADIDKVQTDIRLAVAMTIIRQYKSLTDRMFARVTESGNVISITITENEVYDLAKSADASAAVRNRGTHLRPMVELYRDPDPVNTAPKKVIPLSANDTGDVSVMVGDALATGVSANLFDLSMDSNMSGYGNTDFTDLIAEGGKVASVYVEVTNSVGPVSETFKIPVSYFAGARFTMVGNSNDSGDRAAMIKTVAGNDLTSGGMQSDGVTPTVIFNTITDSVYRLNLGFNANLNLKTGEVTGSGTVDGAFVVSADGSAPLGGSAEETLAATLSVKVVAFDLDVSFSEENVRKSTVAVRQNYRPHTFEIPPGRTAIVDVSMSQTSVEGALDAVSTVNSLGNSARMLDIITGVMADVAARNAFEAASPGLPYANKVSREYASGSQVLPYIATNTLDFSTEAAEIAVLRESERLTEMHARTTSRILSLISEVNANSLYHNCVEPGEGIVYKVVAGAQLVDLLFGIENYHNSLNDAPEGGGRKQAGADYSMMLPNGARLDIYKTDFVGYANRVVGVPVRAANAEDITSFGSIRDRGTYVGSYTVTGGGAANRRFITNSREILFVTDPVGFDLTVENLASIWSI